MRVLHFAQKILLERGGVVRAVIDMASVVAARGHDVIVMTHDASDAPDGWGSAAADADDAPGLVDLGPMPAGQRLTGPQLDVAKREIDAADVLHIHAVWNPANLQLARLARQLGTPYVQSIHGMLDDWSMAQSTIKKRIFLALGGGRTLREAAAVHCTAEAELQQAKKWFKKNAAAGVVVPLVFDLSPYEPLPGPGLAREAFADELAATGDETTPTVLFLARIHYKKGVDVFIESIAELARRGVACRALIAGTSDDAGYMERMRGAGRKQWYRRPDGFSWPGDRRREDKPV